MEEKPIHDNHRGRMKKRMRANGINSLSEHEAVEMLLYYSIRRGDTNETAHRLIERFGSLIGVLEAPPEELARVDGIGAYSAEYIYFVHELAVRYQRELAVRSRNAVRLRTHEQFGAYFAPQFEGMTEECLLAAYLDNAGRVLRCEAVTTGGVSHVPVDLGAIVRRANLCNSAVVAIAHNHPGGDAVPSREDVDMTIHIAGVLSDLGMTLVEHTLVANGQTCSIAQFIWPHGRGR